MFTEGFVFVWVKQIISNDGPIRLSGFPFDDEFGLPQHGSRYFSGELYCISTASGRTHGSGVISVAHTANRGMHWRLDSEIILPDSPFLLTSHQNIYCVVDGARNEMNCQSSSLYSDEAEIAVAGNEWCGVIQLRRGVARFLAIFAKHGWSIKFPMVAKCASDASELVFSVRQGGDTDRAIREVTGAGET